MRTGRPDDVLFGYEPTYLDAWEHGAPVGTLTSPCESPTLGKVIGMAVLESGYSAVGERVEVAVGDGTAAATVATLPVYDPEKARPRA